MMNFDQLAGESIFHSKLGEIKLKDLGVFDLFELAATRHRDHVAVIDNEDRYTFLELKNRCEHFAAVLQAGGFNKGDRLALMLANSIEYVIVFFAVQRLGGTIVQVNPMYQAKELETILLDSEATWFVGKQEEKIKLEKTKISDSVTRSYVDTEGKALFHSSLDKEGRELRKVTINTTEDVAVLQYTGGTTGTPKGVMLTPYNILVNLHQHYVYGEPVYSEPGHSLLGVAPMFHAMGLINMIFCLSLGGTYIPVKRFQINPVMELIRKHRPTLLQGSPTMYLALLNYPDLHEEDLQCFKLCACGSAPAPIEVIKRFKQASRSIFIEGYGLSEATTLVFRNPLTGKRKIGSIGVPAPYTEVKLVDPDTGLEEISRGQPGEMIIRGPQVMKGYWKNTEETKKTIRGGWLYTGDIARQDDDGYFYIVGRKKDMIIAGGYNIYPKEIEEVLQEHPSVSEACVYGIPDSYRGETVKAVIVLIQTTTEEELKIWCQERLAKYKVPRVFEFRDELPKSNVGKILRRQLVEEEQANSRL